jgi:hypothetical protein
MHFFLDIEYSTHLKTSSLRRFTNVKIKLSLELSIKTYINSIYLF